MKHCFRIIALLFGVWFASPDAYAQTVNAYEYWFDDEFDNRQLRAVSPVQELNLNLDIDASSLNDGFHWFRVRYLDGNGKWSPVLSQPFANTGLITAYEYWFDDAFTARQLRTIAPTQELNINQDLDVSTLSGGFHWFRIRYKDATGNWSKAYSQPFAHTGPVKTLEYWYDSDFTNRKTATLTQAMELEVDRLIDGPAKLGGFHDLYLRYMDEVGNWCPVMKHNFLFAPADNHVTGVYYWFNKGYDKKKYLAFTGKTNPIEVDTLLSLIGENLPQDSLADLHLQFTDVVGQLSSVFTHRFDNCNTSKLVSVTPDKAGNKGNAKLILKGFCIPEGGTVFLRKEGQKDIHGAPIEMIDPRNFSSVFDLDGVAVGKWDVVLKNGTNEIVMTEAFTVEEGRFNISVDIIGRDVVRTNTPSTFQIAVTNNGNNDVVGAPLIVAVSSNVTLNFENLIFAPELREPDFPLDSFPNILDSFPRWAKIKPEWTDIPIKNGKLTLIFLSAIPVGQTKYITVSLTSKANQQFEMYASVGYPLYEAESGSGKNSAVRQSKAYADCFADIVKATVKLVGRLGAPVVTCVTDALYSMGDAAYKYQYIGEDDYTKSDYAWEMASNIIKTTVNCALLLDPSGLRYAYELAWGAADFATDIYQVVQDCKGAKAPASAQIKKGQSRASLDPNEKMGPEGIGGTNVLSGLRPMNYTIQFENKDTLINGKPTLPAQKVLVLDSLDKTKFVMKSFQWGEVRIGNAILKSPIVSDTIQLQFDLRPKRNMIVDIYGTLDTTKGIIRCVMQALDPITKKAIDDPMDGFLPPNTVAPEGEGYVTFSILPREDIPAGTPIRNRAAIYFDANPAIITNTYTNRFDMIKPVSRITSAERVNDTTYKVKWNASDVGVGVRHVTIWASLDDEPYRRVIVNASGNEGTFVGGWRKGYKLYSIAQDSVYNTEDPPTEPDTVLVSRADLLYSHGVDYFQNYPNPFEGTTEIRYALKQAETDVTIVIHDLYGKTVRVLAEKESQASGIHSYTFNAEELPAGTYFCVLTTKHTRQVRKLMLIK